jgi:uncharacterized membrane protein YcaP (DUF421 family)
VEVVIRATVVFWLLWALLRAAGKRELAEMTPFELILLMVFGDLIQQGVTEEDMSITGAALAVTTMMLWALAFSYGSYRVPFLRRRLEASPSIVVRHGVVDRAALAIQRLHLDDLLDEARLAGIADIAEVEYAVLEADGKMSFLRRRSEPGGAADTRHDGTV